MDDPRVDICYISSDEEMNDDFDWLRALMDDDDHESDDVVFVRKENDDDDDDCVVLDEDPDKPVEVKGNDKWNNDDSDDLLVVSEKGQVACRDYPHPRHLCAKFPFASTPHENHCKQCHCYVCDSLAPCVFWENGNHCDATDEDRFWKARRKCKKESDKAQHIIPNIPVTSLSPQPESLSRWHPNGSQIGTRILPLGSAFKRHGSVSQALKPPGFGYYSPRGYDRSQFVKNLTPGSNPQSRQSSVERCSLWSPVSSESQLPLQLSLGSTSGPPRISSHSPVNGTTYSVPSTFSPSPRANSMFSQPQVAYQPNVGSTYGKNYQSLSSRLHVSGALANSEPSKPQLLSQPNRGNKFENQIHPYMPLGDNYYTNPTQLAFQPNGATSNGSNCYPCQDGRPIFMSNDGQNVSRPANHISSFERDFGVSGEALFNQSNGPHYVGSADQSAFDFQVDNSDFGNPAILRATQVSMRPGANAYPFESPCVDSWNLF